LPFRFFVAAGAAGRLEPPSGIHARSSHQPVSFACFAPSSSSLQKKLGVI
jgi:hypothetical protein